MLLFTGFGDGKYLQVHDGFTIGVEKCKLLCEKVSSNRNEVIVADITRLPFRRQFFDGLVCVGVIHHLATRRRRSKALHEMARILSLGGKVFLSVWGIEATFEEVFLFTSKFHLKACQYYFYISVTIFINDSKHSRV